MKLLSSSPSISSSSSSSFDPKMCTSKSATAGCLTGILRRILCSGSLPTHPSDHIAEATSVASHDKNQQCDKFDGSKVSPCIVARLMGLDSLPDISLLKSQANPNSITRSRSLNSADYKQDSIDGSIYVKHRRVNSSLSFRHMPTYFELENEDYFVLSFEKESERKEVRSKKRREENQKDKEGSSKRVLNVLSEEKLNRRTSVEKPNEEATKCKPTPPIVSSKMVDKPDQGAKLRKKKKKTQHWVAQNAEPESSSEDSSPVSVLDFDQYIIDHDVPTTSEEDSSKPDLDNDGCKLSPSNEGNLMEADQRVNKFEGKKLGSRVKVWHTEMNMECWDSICRMSEAEVAKSSWLCSKEEDLQEITADFGSKILDQLLEELVVQHFGSLP